MLDRVESTSPLTTTPCGQKLAITCGKVAVSSLSNATALAAELPLVDSILTFSATPTVPQAVAFGATLDPGAGPWFREGRKQKWGKG